MTEVCASLVLDGGLAVTLLIAFALPRCDRRRAQKRTRRPVEPRAFALGSTVSQTSCASAYADVGAVGGCALPGRTGGEVIAAVAGRTRPASPDRCAGDVAGA